MHSARLFDLCHTRKMLVTPIKLTHNADPFRRPADFSVPVMRFFGLPSIGGQPPRIPLTAFALPALLREPMVRPGCVEPLLGEPKAPAACLSCSRLACAIRSEADEQPGSDEVSLSSESAVRVPIKSTLSALDPFCGSWARSSTGKTKGACGSRSGATPERWRDSV
uniref:Uncharacterized protein n=1 Tax=Alexandrium catenella TaxID=2925 RepID=A0A7S1WU76_ALECA